MGSAATGSGRTRAQHNLQSGLPDRRDRMSSWPGFEVNVPGRLIRKVFRHCNGGSLRRTALATEVATRWHRLEN